MESDPIVAEVRKIREERAALFGYNVRAIAEDARRRDASGDREIVRRPPRRPRPAHVVNKVPGSKERQMPCT